MSADLHEGLGPAGRSYYLTRQIPLDTAYPALLTLTLVLARAATRALQLIEFELNGLCLLRS